jgi:hypothetical protein
MIKGLRKTSVGTDQKHTGKPDKASSLGTLALGVWSLPAASFSSLFLYLLLFKKKSSLTSS